MHKNTYKKQGAFLACYLLFFTDKMMFKTCFEPEMILAFTRIKSWSELNSEH